ncbi:AP180 N-terminal homology (ANTH) domain [Dillenia turbinata]|uniref:AP180 N-terminal homology (ANTH) domain n=1 Tax=Dillenia turbinata TaxID=194707 RepID=A0AAN8V5Y6_9MAGN
MEQQSKHKLQDLIGAIKDKASQTKAIVLSNSPSLSFHLSLLRATTHHPTTPPPTKHINTILSFGHSSRATASATVDALMRRLHSTRSPAVALKCLLTVHLIIRRGTFILQDQLSIFPSFGGHNYLNLSDFRDNRSPTSWELSSWVRWYARYLEHLLSTSRVLGFFLCSTSSTLNKDHEEDAVSSLMNNDLVKEVDSLVSLIEETQRIPESLHVDNNDLIFEIMGLVGDDYKSALNEVSLRVNEFRERLSHLSFGDSVEFVCCMKRLEDCEERLTVLFPMMKRALTESFWGLVGEMKKIVGSCCAEKGERKKLVGWRGDRGSESARFDHQVLRSDKSFRFGSGRMSSLALPIEESGDQWN